MDSDATDDAGTGPAAPNPAFEQFQRAALEAIGAARVMLEAAEHVVRDPAAVEAAVRTVSDIARTATETVTAVASDAMARARQASDTAPHEGPGPVDDADGGDEPPAGYQRIDLG